MGVIDLPPNAIFRVVTGQPDTCDCENHRELGVFTEVRVFVLAGGKQSQVFEQDLLGPHYPAIYLFCKGREDLYDAELAS